MVYINISLEGDVTEDKYESIKEKLPQIAQQLELKCILNATHKIE